MPIQETQPRWISRTEEIATPVEDIRLPEKQALSQDQEWCEAVIAGQPRRFRFHNYGDLYRVPGLYEKLFYECLKCCSPSRVVGLLDDVIADFQEDPEQLRVLDVGAGNGMVGDEMDMIGAEHIVGIDIIEEARRATFRDRPGVYDSYLVTDLADLPEHQEERLRKQEFNCLTTVAALGFGDIPPKAFAKALDMVSVPGWLAFNIKEDFLCERDDTGFAGLVRQLTREEVIQIQAYRRYQHRLSSIGTPLHYVAVVARKLRDLPDNVEELWAETDQRHDDRAVPGKYVGRAAGPSPTPREGDSEAGA